MPRPDFPIDFDEDLDDECLAWEWVTNAIVVAEDMTVPSLRAGREFLIVWVVAEHTIIRPVGLLLWVLVPEASCCDW